MIYLCAESDKHVYTVSVERGGACEHYCDNGLEVDLNLSLTLQVAQT